MILARTVLLSHSDGIVQVQREPILIQPMLAIVIDPRQSRIVAWHDDDKTLWAFHADFTGGKVLRKFSSAETVRSIVFGLDGAVLFTFPDSIMTIDVTGHSVTTAVKGYVQAVGPDGTAVVIRGRGVGLWHQSKFMPLHKMQGGAGGGMFEFSPSGKWLLRLGEIPGVSTALEVIDVSTAHVVSRTMLRESDVRVAKWASDQSVVLAGETGWVDRRNRSTLRETSRVVTVCALNSGGSPSPDGSMFFGMGAFPLPGGGVGGVGIFDLDHRRFLGVVPNPSRETAPYEVQGLSNREYWDNGEHGLTRVRIDVP